MGVKNKKRQLVKGLQTSDDISEESPLQLFSEAKDRINDIFLRLQNSASKVSQFYSDTQLDQEVLENVDTGRIRKLNESIQTIRGILSRDRMKVAFFGRTSNGKSTVINAILHNEVLPAGPSRITCCFLQIQGTEGDEPFLEVPKNGQPSQPDEKQPIQSISHIANSFKNGAAKCSTLVKVNWPIKKCPLLKHDVVLVDSPGIGCDRNLDHWIHEHCHDADVFVLIFDAGSTPDLSEMDFFRGVIEKLSKPNIFILNNKLDLIADHPDLMDVKKRDVEEAVSFLSDELKISSRDEAKQRIFFVSAQETLQTRSTDSSSYGKVGYHDRLEEFENFERRFEESLSKSAIETKFKGHVDKGKETIDELSSILNTTRSLVDQVSQKKRTEYNQNVTRYQSIHNLFFANVHGLEEKIHDLKKSIQILAGTELENEFRRLKHIVEDFEADFSPNQPKLFNYKKQLYSHVEESLGGNVGLKIHAVITKQIQPFNRVMCDIGKLLSEERQRRIEQIVGSQTYVQDDLFDLKIYKQFYTEFQEDLEFRFSLGIVSIIRKIQAKFNNGKPITTVNGGLDLSQTQPTLSADTDFLAVAERFMLTSPQSPTTVGTLAVGGVLVRTVGWKVIIGTAIVYGALYAYEYLTWTNSKKERTFKAQYVKYARKRLQECVPIISQHISNSVEQKLTATFSKVKGEVEIENKEVTTQIGLLKSSVEKLQYCEDFTKNLLGENYVLMNELVAFASSFLAL